MLIDGVSIPSLQRCDGVGCLLVCFVAFEQMRIDIYIHTPTEDIFSSEITVSFSFNFLVRKFMYSLRVSLEDRGTGAQ